MNTLIAGGAGFLGSHLTELLIAKGHNVVVVDNLSSGLMSNLESVKDKIGFIKADITADEISITGGLDLVVNMASRASRAEWEKYPVEVALSNSLGSSNLIKIALAKKARYIFASTSEVYGNPDVVPTPETYKGNLNHLGSRAPYDESKIFGETLTKAYEAEYGLESIIIRFFNTYGPRMRGGDMYGRVIDRFIKQAMANEPITVYGTGSQTRSFTYVSDTINAVMLLIEKGKPGEIYNIGTNKELSIVELAKTVIEVTGSKSEIVYSELPKDDPLRRGADNSKISALGWAPEIGVREGLAKMMESYRA
ncbi:TPA: NAD-dependent epimerase/dehydratase family protein [Candidatus Micrarchaeota archaeon]|nr:NAD-dependent epimerase/dehydratase family protein [Candidatus Micrarchaeota archaeon]HII09689.1 NAD-dependent epimerase/dehydratase family protein [Candidatus Micrarchaeota archaeon]